MPECLKRLLQELPREQAQEIYDHITDECAEDVVDEMMVQLEEVLA